MDINTDQEFANVTLSFTTASGQPANVQPGSIVWASSNETVLRTIPNPDGMGGTITTVAPSLPGTPERVTFTADADLGAGVVTLTGVSEDINVTLGPSSQASVMSVSLGAPTAKVVTPPTP